MLTACARRSVPLEGKVQVWQHDVIPILVHLLKDRDEEVQANAAGALMNAAVTTEGEAARAGVCRLPRGRRAPDWPGVAPSGAVLGSALFFRAPPCHPLVPCFGILPLTRPFVNQNSQLTRLPHP